MKLLFKTRNMLIAGGLIILFLHLSCGTEAPAGAKITMPADTTIEASEDVTFYIDAVVTDSNGTPMNDIDVEFFICCVGYFIDYNNTYVKLKTDKRGIARVGVLIPGEFEGDVTIDATIGTADAQTKITKKLPATQ